MSCIGSEVETLTSEDFGFKKLGQVTILPSYDEKLPFASLQNLDISNHGSLYAACSGNKVVIGELQQLRDYIQNDANSELSFKWEKEVDDVIAVKLIRDQRLVYVTKQSQVFELDLNKLGEPTEVFNFNCDLVYVKFWRSSILLALDSDGQLRSLHLAQLQLAPLLENVAAFDVHQDKLCVFFRSFSVEIYELSKWNQLSKYLEFATPPELLDEIKEEYLPVSITALASHEYQLVFGIPVSSEEEDVSYDHKIFVVKKLDDKITFQESFDITPAFGSVLRYPMYYNEKLSDLVYDIPQINILASSCSSEITIWDSANVVQPLQDSERAVLPISKVTDNDTNPVGIALDIASKGAVAQPCPGVDSVDKMPLIYVLNNEGSLQIIGFYHATAIKEGKFNVNSLAQSIIAQETAEEVALEKSGSEGESKEQENSINSIGELSLGSEENKTESKPFFGNLKKADPSTSNSQDSTTSSEPSFGKSSFGQPRFGESSFGNPSFGQSPFSQSAFGRPVFGTASFGTSAEPSSTAHDKPSFGVATDSSTSAFGKPSFGTKTDPPAPAFGKPAFGKPSFGASSELSTSAFGKPAFGKPAFGASLGSEVKPGGATESAFGKPAFGKPAFGASSGSEVKPGGTTESAFGKPGFAQPSFGQPSFGNSSFGNSSFGQPSFGRPSLGFSSNDQNSVSSAFGKPSFGSNSNTGFGAFASAKEKSPFETSTLNTSGSSFGNFAKGQSKNESPFANLVKRENNDNVPLSSAEKKDGDTLDKSKPELKTETPNSSPPSEAKLSFGRPFTGSSTKPITTPEKPTFGSSALGGISSNKRQSPFAALAKDENLPVFTTPSYGANTTRPHFAQSLAAPSSPSKQKSSPLGQKEGQNEEEQDMSVKEAKKLENPLFEAKTSVEEKDALDNVDDSSDSTAKQTPAKSESSISSLTAKIKESAILSSSDLKSPNITQQPKTKEGKSPFAQYTNDLTKPSSTGFTFSQVPSLNKEKEDLNSAFKLQISAKNDKDAEYQTSESSENEGSPSHEFETSDQIVHGDSVNGGSNKKIEFGGTDEGRQKISEIKKESDNTGSSSPTALSGVSREESYDTLDDFTQGELANAGTSSGSAAGYHKARPKMVESTITENPNDDRERNVQIQSSPPVLVSNSTQVEKAASGDADCQTSPVELSDFNVQAFENDDLYLGEQYRPKPMPGYFSGASVTNVKYSSRNPVLKSIERTYHYVSAELSVLAENISGLDRFFQDQCLKHPLKLNESSITNMYQWRIPDAPKLQTILSEKNKPLKELYGEVESTRSKLSELSSKGIESLQQRLVVIRDEYSNLEKLNREFQKGLGDLRYHQLDKRSILRTKMFRTFETIQHIEKLLQILKLCTIQGKRMESNSYVVKLARDAADRENLLHEIARLREDIRNLNLKNERALEPKESSVAATNDIQSIEVVQVGLTLNTKRRLGEILKKRNNIEA